MNEEKKAKKMKPLSKKKKIVSFDTEMRRLLDKVHIKGSSGKRTVKKSGY